MKSLSDLCHILVIDNETKPRQIIYLKKPIYSIGRDPSNSIVIENVKISRFHATLLRKNNEKNDSFYYQIVDGDFKGNVSKNGLVINGNYSLKSDLNHGDLIAFDGDKTRAYYYIISNEFVVNFFQEQKIYDFQEYTSSSPNQSRETIPNEEKEKIIDYELFRLASFPELSPAPIIEINNEGDITYINYSALIKFPHLKKNKLNHPILEGLINHQSNKQGDLLIREVKIDEEFFEQHIHFLGGGRLIRIYIVDLTKRKQVEIKLRASEERHRAIFSQTSDGIVLVDLINKKILEANKAYCQLLEYTTEELLELTLDDVIHDREIFYKSIEKNILEKKNWHEESIYRKKDGSLMDVELSVNLIHYEQREVLCFIVRDITNRKRSAEELQYQAFHDGLTGLPNRNLFDEQLATAIANAKRYKHTLAVIFIDIDYFKSINDSHGHYIGDELLKSFAERLKSILRAGDTISRRGGDEFTILLPVVSSTEDVAKLTERLLDSLQKPFVLSELKLYITTSIGIALYPYDGEDAENLLDKADQALYLIKKQGRNGFQFYNMTMNSWASKLLYLENLLPLALAKEEFFIQYQPIVNINNLQTTGMEAFISWVHQDELILAKEFIPLAEKSDLIIYINEWVLLNACTQNKLWQQSGFKAIPISVNVSYRQLLQPDFPKRVADILQQSNLEAQWLELEIRQTSVMNNLDQFQKNLSELLAMGIRLSIDDFGTGFFSVNCFKEFKFKTIKLNQCLVTELKEQTETSAIVSAIISLGYSFNMRIVAESVETEEQLELLRFLDCQEVQGKIFSLPLAVEAANRWLHSN